MTKGALGLYDSGIGGKTVLAEIRKLFPDIEIHYLADTKSLPLGDKSKEEIRQIVKKGVEFLFNKGCVLVILACNTASVNTRRYLTRSWLKYKHPNKKLLGISIPLGEHMAEKYVHLKNKKGVILSTPATLKTRFYQAKLKKLGFNNFISIPCPGLAEAIETGDKAKIKNKIQQLSKGSNSWTKCDYVVLACTHYPLALKQFKQIFPKKTVFIDQSKPTAEKLKTYLKKHKEFDLKAGKTYFWKT